MPHQANKRIIDGMAKRLGSMAGARGGDHRQARQHLGRLDPAGPGEAGDDGRINQAIWCSSKRSAAASPGVRRSFAVAAAPITRYRLFGAVHMRQSVTWINNARQSFDIDAFIATRYRFTN